MKTPKVSNVDLFQLLNMAFCEGQDGTKWEDLAYTFRCARDDKALADMGARFFDDDSLVNFYVQVKLAFEE